MADRRSAITTFHPVPPEEKSNHCLTQITEEGKAKCAAAKTIHGRETRQKRAYISTKMAELHELETLGRKIGLISGPKTAGRKPQK